MSVLMGGLIFLSAYLFICLKRQGQQNSVLEYRAERYQELYLESVDVAMGNIRIADSLNIQIVQLREKLKASDWRIKKLIQDAEKQKQIVGSMDAHSTLEYFIYRTDGNW